MPLSSTERLIFGAYDCDGYHDIYQSTSHLLSQSILCRWELRCKVHMVHVNIVCSAWLFGCHSQWRRIIRQWYFCFDLMRSNIAIHRWHWLLYTSLASHVMSFHVISIFHDFDHQQHCHIFKRDLPCHGIILGSGRPTGSKPDNFLSWVFFLSAAFQWIFWSGIRLENTVAWDLERVLL